MHRKTCRLCAAPTGPVILDLGMQPPSNDFTSPGSWHCDYPLQLVKCNFCSLLQLNFDVPPDQIFHGGYPLHSSKGSLDWLKHAEALARTVMGGTGGGAHVVEIGSNDGYLLRHLKNHCSVLGIDPTGIPSEVTTIDAKFNSALALALRRADVVLALNTVAQIPDLADFFKGLALLLQPRGTAILEFPDVACTIAGGQFDQIYHEHYSYLSVIALRTALSVVGMNITRVQRLPTHGGSLRVFIEHGFADVDDEDPTVTEQIKREQVALSGTAMKAFAERASKCRQEYRHFAVSSMLAGCKVYGYGAAAKGNTFLNYVYDREWKRVNWDTLKGIGEVNPQKIGLHAPGTGYKVIAEDEMLAAKPNYILLLAWNWRDEAIKRLREKGYTGAFVVAVPELEVIYT